LLLFLSFNARGGAILFIIAFCAFFRRVARFFARHEAFNVALFGVQNSVHNPTWLE
jgi:hypothetical protein